MVAAPAEAPDDMEWPDDGDEAEFLSGSANRGESAGPAPGRDASPVVGEKLPALEELVARVPEGVRGILDDLFRAKFTGVRRFTAATQGDPPR